MTITNAAAETQTLQSEILDTIHDELGAEETSGRKNNCAEI